MRDAVGGKFCIHVWKGGFPTWCVMKYNDDECAKFSTDELSDLIYAATKALEQYKMQEKAHEYLLMKDKFIS